MDSYHLISWDSKCFAIVPSNPTTKAPQLPLKPIMFINTWNEAIKTIKELNNVSSKEMPKLSQEVK